MVEEYEDRNESGFDASCDPEDEKDVSEHGENKKSDRSSSWTAGDEGSNLASKSVEKDRRSRSRSDREEGKAFYTGRRKGQKKDYYRENERRLGGYSISEDIDSEEYDRRERLEQQIKSKTKKEKRME